MKFSINNDDQLDVFFTSIQTQNIPAPKRTWWYNPLRTMWCAISTIISKAKAHLRADLPTNLYGISLGTYLKVCKPQPASSILKTICEEYGIKHVPQANKVPILVEWMDQIAAISKKMEEAQPNVKGEGYQQAIWSQCAERHKVPPTLWMLDSLAKRFNKTYAEVSKMSISDVLVALSIDACNAEYESRVMDWQRQQSKRK